MRLCAPGSIAREGEGEAQGNGALRAATDEEEIAGMMKEEKPLEGKQEGPTPQRCSVASASNGGLPVPGGGRSPVPELRFRR